MIQNFFSADFSRFREIHPRCFESGKFPGLLVLIFFCIFSQVYLPSCTLDDFSGARGPIRGSDGDRIWFHGRHIFSSLLRDLVANFGIDQAESIVLIGSGSGARGVGHR